MDRKAKSVGGCWLFVEQRIKESKWENRGGSNAIRLHAARMLRSEVTCKSGQIKSRLIEMEKLSKSQHLKQGFILHLNCGAAFVDEELQLKTINQLSCK